MEKPRISESTREKLDEAAVSVFMDQYAAALNAGIDRTIEDSATIEFPPELDKRCQALIAHETHKQLCRTNVKRTLRMLRSVAAVVMILLSVSSILFITVEAFRIPVISFFVEKHDSYLEFRSKPKENEIVISFNPDDPLGNILSDEYVLVDIDIQWQDGMVIASYCSDSKANIFFSIDPSVSTMRMDDENASSHHFRLFDHDAYILTEGDMIRLVWMDAGTDRTFTLCSDGVEKETLIAIAETIVLMFD